MPYYPRDLFEIQVKDLKLHRIYYDKKDIDSPFITKMKLMRKREEANGYYSLGFKHLYGQTDYIPSDDGFVWFLAPSYDKYYSQRKLKV